MSARRVRIGCALAASHHLTADLAGINALTDALVAS
jgi:hypothetical protein